MVRLMVVVAFVGLFLYGATPATAGTTGRVVVTLTLRGDIPDGDFFSLHASTVVPGVVVCGVDPAVNPYFPNSEPCVSGQKLVVESGEQPSGTLFAYDVYRNDRRVPELSGRVVVREGTTHIALVFDYNLSGLPNTAVSTLPIPGVFPVMTVLGIVLLAMSAAFVRRRYDS
jgi:hypothetical protein